MGLVDEDLALFWLKLVTYFLQLGGSQRDNISTTPPSSLPRYFSCGARACSPFLPFVSSIYNILQLHSTYTLKINNYYYDKINTVINYIQFLGFYKFHNTFIIPSILAFLDDL